MVGPLFLLAAFYATLVMAGIIGIHIYWWRGGFWPGRTEAELVDRVVGQGESMPGHAAFAIVILGLGAMASLPSLLFATEPLVSPALMRGALTASAMVLALRALAFFIPALAARASKLFLRNDRRFFAPLCLSLALAYAILAQGIVV